MFVSVMYHFVHSADDDAVFRGIPGPTTDQFEGEIKRFLKNGFYPIKTEELIQSLDKGKKLPNKAFNLTFDEGLKQNFKNVLPVLKQYDLEGSFFITTSPLLDEEIGLTEKQRVCQYSLFSNYSEFVSHFVEAATARVPGFHEHYKSLTGPSKSVIENYLKEFHFYNFEERLYRYLRNNVLNKEQFQVIIDDIFLEKYPNPRTFIEKYYMNENEIKEMHLNGMIIGGHSHSHPYYSNISYQEQLKETKKSLDHLSSMTGTHCDIFAYPFGSFNNTSFLVMKDLGVKLSYGTENKVNEDISRFAISRIDHSDLKRILGEQFR